MPRVFEIDGRMVKYQVFDNGKPADCHHHPKVHSSWDRSVFDTLAEAQAYARKWLGIYAPSGPIPVDTPWDYSGMGDVIEIRTIQGE